ncbi:MAG: cation:H+ antiporter, partial [Actinomycetota bacterium]|nr:cation:H+ antiporter [Actinomycetota bacterium]
MSDQPRPGRPGLTLVASGLITLPGILVRLTGVHPAHWLAALCFGLAIVGAAFLLGWGAEVVQLDISAGLALAVLALIAVLPEYAVDFVFTSKAGTNPKEFAPLALANMTGANQLLIGVGWSLVVLLAAYRIKKVGAERGSDPSLQPVVDPSPGRTPTDVVLARSHSVEVAFLMGATAYGLTLPFKRTISLVDAVVLVAIFVAYLVRVARAPAEEPHLVGTALFVASRPVRDRRIAVGAMFVGAAAIILLCAEPFAESLVSTGEEFGVSTFLLVKWLAPLASEAPELLIAGMFAWRLNTNAGLGALVSSKVNQWTLLVGTLPIVFAISSRSHHGLPLDALQREELFVTAAQSAFAVAILASRSISVREARLLLGLFVVQFISTGALPGDLRGPARIITGVVYLALAGAQLFRERRQLPAMVHDG